MSKKYESSNVDVLSDIEHIRLRPGMYVGGANEKGYNHIAKEVIDNSLDECLAGHATLVRVVLDGDHKGMSVVDDGRGIPFTKHEKTGLSTLVTVFSFGRSGAKFDNKAYGTSVGLHGVGATATNALSEEFEAYSFRKSKQAKATFKRGILQGKDAEVTKNTSTIKHGTVVHFRPDPEIFKTIDSYSSEEIKESLAEVAYLLPNATIEFKDSPKAQVEKLPSENGLLGLLKSSFGDEFTSPIFHEEFTFEVDTKDGPATAIAEVAFGWVNSSHQESKVFVNLTRNDDGGSHENGSIRGITAPLIAKGKNKFTEKEALAGLRFITHVKHPSPEFSSQTKEKLINRKLTSQISTGLAPLLEKWMRKNSAWVKDFITSCTTAFEESQQEKDKKKALKNLKKVKKSSRGILPGKLVEADCTPDKRELFIVEGDSAMGSVRKARDAKFQEILPIRGKILNSVRTDLATALKNKEISAIVTSIGAGISDTFNVSKSRASKVILLSDADPDGKHITSLLLGLFVTYMPGLIEDGRVYIVDSPLFKATVQGTHERFYAHTMESLKKKAGRKFSKCDISRLKGHGEANADEVGEYAMNIGTRKLIQVSLTDDTLKTTNDLMGDDSEPRKKLLGL